MTSRTDLIFAYLGQKFGFKMSDYRSLVMESKGWSKSQWDQYHNELLPKVIKHAYQHVPYYHNLFDSYGIYPESIQTEDDLLKLPITRKKDILANPQSFLADNAKQYHPIHHHTGGTTGKPCPYLNDRKSWALNWAVKMHTFSEAGFCYGKDRLAVLAGGSLIPGKNTGTKHKIWRWINNYYSMPITHLTSEIMEGYLDGLIKENISFMRGYPSAVATFAEYIVSTGRCVPLKAVFTTAEMLYPHQRDIIRQAFDCETWNTYGCGDGMGQASDCALHDKMHVWEQVSIMQIADNIGQEVTSGEEGEIVLTSLYDYAMPFIRYAPGDLAIKGSDGCECGYNGKTINKIIGRSSDVFRFSNGRILNGLSFPVEELTKEVNKYQIIQTEKDTVEFFIEGSDFLNESIVERLRKVVEYHCGNGVKVIVKVVDNIEVPTSEKFRYIVSRVN